MIISSILARIAKVETADVNMDAALKILTNLLGPLDVASSKPAKSEDSVTFQVNGSKQRIKSYITILNTKFGISPTSNPSRGLYVWTLKNVKGTPAGRALILGLSIAFSGGCTLSLTNVAAKIEYTPAFKALVVFLKRSGVTHVVKVRQDEDESYAEIEVKHKTFTKACNLLFVSRRNAVKQFIMIEGLNKFAFEIDYSGSSMSLHHGREASSSERSVYNDTING